MSLKRKMTRRQPSKRKTPSKRQRLQNPLVRRRLPSPHVSGTRFFRRLLTIDMNGIKPINTSSSTCSSKTSQKINAQSTLNLTAYFLLCLIATNFQVDSNISSSHRVRFHIHIGSSRQSHRPSYFVLRSPLH